MKTYKQVLMEAYEELLSKPEFKAIRDAMLLDIIEIAQERVKQIEEEENAEIH